MQIHTIATRFFVNVFTNCYLIQEGEKFFLIDTGMPNHRSSLDRQIAGAGCVPGSLKLILVTHGDKDHIGNAAFFRTKYSAPIAMHPGDAGMAETGSMFSGRTSPNPAMRWIGDNIMGLAEADRFKPDILLNDGDNLKSYGFDAKAIHMPGHSSGSIGILTGDGDLFCGDLFGNISKPALWSIIDSPDEAKKSIEKLKKLDIRTVYPGHGKPFNFEKLMTNLRS